MPIRQLRPSNQQRSATGFTTHRLGSAGAGRSQLIRRSVGSDRDQRLDNGSGARRTGGFGRRRPVGRRNFRRAVFWFIFRIGLAAVFLGGIAVVGVFAWYSRDLPDPNRIIDRDLALSTKIYDRTGVNLLYEIHGAQRRTLIELSDIPQYAIDATVAIEDKNFYKHSGLSLHNIAKAVVLEALRRVGLYRKLVPGGSTLTQQFIKNAVLTTEKSYERKIKEFVLAYRIEKKFTKDQILKMYFNEIPYGSTAYGIETAAHIYFDKSAKDLTLAEAAVLAALPQAPSYYSPYGSRKDELLARQRYILDLMAQQRYITSEQAADAKKQELVFKKRREDIRAPHFVFMVKEELSRRYGERLVEQGGLKIITTLDMDKQKAAEEVVSEVAAQNAEKYKAGNTSLVSIDIKTGEVLALVGSRDFFDDTIDGQVNVAVAPRQPGSSLKPVVYAEAFAMGYRPDTVVFDLETSFAAAGKEYRPQNYDGKERGPIDLRHALQGSLNIPAVKVLYLVGARNAVKRAQELGYTTLTDPDRYGLSLVLGGAEVRLVEHVNAYAALAREGVFKPYITTLRVEDGSGGVLEEHRDTTGARALPREIARLITNVLSDNSARSFIFGAGNYLTLPGRAAAAKTGTTNNYHDAWTIGYTPQIATGVWVGNSDNAPMDRGADGSVVAAPIWQKFMTKILTNVPPQGFAAAPELAPCEKPMLCGGVGTELKIKVNRQTGKRASPYTPASVIEERVYREIHDILHYVDRADPTGLEPDDPARDPQYALWERPVRVWAEKQDFAAQSPPTEVDDLYKPEDQPEISWISPQGGETLTSPAYTFTVNARSRRGVARVRYFMNDAPIGDVTQRPFSLSFRTSPLTPNGAYELRAAASDDIGNEKSASVYITLNVQRTDEWSITWISPVNTQRIAATAPVTELRLAVTNPEKLKKIDFYMERGPNPVFLGYESVLGRPIITHSWSAPGEAGEYSLYLVATDANNQTFTLPAITVIVAD